MNTFALIHLAALLNQLSAYKNKSDIVNYAITCAEHVLYLNHHPKVTACWEEIARYRDSEILDKETVKAVIIDARDASREHWGTPMGYAALTVCEAAESTIAESITPLKFCVNNAQFYATKADKDMAWQMAEFLRSKIEDLNTRNY